MGPIVEQQSSILSEQELHLLASHPQQALQSHFRVYSYQTQPHLADCEMHVAHSIEQLMFMLSASPLGIALILPDNIVAEDEPQSQHHLSALLTLLHHRADIRVFLFGRRAPLQNKLSSYVHCHNDHALQQKIAHWKDYVSNLFTGWIKQYRVTLISEDKPHKQHVQDFEHIGLNDICYLDGQTPLSALSNPQLLIIDLETPSLHLVNILKQLTNNEWFPIIVIYGRLPANVCQAAYTFIENSGFHILASITDIPDNTQWRSLFSSLFSKLYLRHWVREETNKVNAYKLYDLATQQVISYFCSPGMSKAQIAALPKGETLRHIIHINSLKGWFPDGGKRNVRMKLAAEMHCEPFSLDVCVHAPQKIARTSSFFSALLMARLEKTKVYWHLTEEQYLLTEILKTFPISDVILGESLSHQLITMPSAALLNFIEQAQLEQVNIVASLAPSMRARESLALYGIESVLSE